MLHSMSRSWGSGSGQTTSSSSSSVTLNRRISLRYAHLRRNGILAWDSGQLHTSCHLGGKFYRVICIVNRYQSRLFERHFGRCARVLRRNENSKVRTRREATMPNRSRGLVYEISVVAVSIPPSPNGFVRRFGSMFFLGIGGDSCQIQIEN